MKKTRSKKSRDTVPLKRQCHKIILFKKNKHSFVVVVATMEIMYEDEYTGFFPAVLFTSALKEFCHMRQTLGILLKSYRVRIGSFVSHWLHCKIRNRGVYERIGP
jgi:hypothetical protein